jgi:hypothetical protein
MSDLVVGRPFAAVVNSSNAAVITGIYSLNPSVGDGTDLEVDDDDPAFAVKVVLWFAILATIFA